MNNQSVFSSLSYFFQTSYSTVHLFCVCDSLRWAGCSNVQIHKICLEVSEPFQVPIKILLHLAFQKSLQIPVQEASLQVKSIFMKNVPFWLILTCIVIYGPDQLHLTWLLKMRMFCQSQFNNWFSRNWKILYSMYNAWNMTDNLNVSQSSQWKQAAGAASAARCTDISTDHYVPCSALFPVEFLLLSLHLPLRTGHVMCC